jgi:hypothetical protein
LNDLVTQRVKEAKVVFTADGSEIQAYYDYAKLKEMEQAQSSPALPNAPPNPDKPAKAEVEKQKALVDAELDALLKKNPKDGAIALRIAKDLKANNFTSPAQALAQRDRLIQLYEVALDSGMNNTVGQEDRKTRFELAQLYRDKTQFDKADKQLQKISRLLEIRPPIDLGEMQDYKSGHEQLVFMFKSIHKDEEAEAEQKKVASLTVQIAEENKKQLEAQKKQLEENKKQQEQQRREEELQKQKEQNNKKPTGTPPMGGTSTPTGSAPGLNTTPSGSSNTKPAPPKQ